MTALSLGLIFLILFIRAGLELNFYSKLFKEKSNYLNSLAQVKDLEEKAALRDGLIRKIQEGNIPVDGLLKLFSVVTPKEIVLDNFLLDQASHQARFRGTIIGDEETAKMILTNFMAELEKSSFVTEATLLTTQSNGPVLEFEINCDLAR